MTDYQEIATQLQEHAASLRDEVEQLRAQLDGDAPNAMRFLQRRTERQRAALDRLNRKVLTQRFRLRLLAELGRDVSREEYEAARDADPNRERINEYVSL